MYKKSGVKKNFAIVAMAAAVVVTVGIGGTFAYFTDKEDVENVLVTGKVDISLDEPLFEQATTNRTMTGIMPGQQIVKDPTITVAKDSNDVYLRTAITIEGLSDMKNEKTGITYEKELEDALKPSLEENGWKKSGNYYYLSKSKKAGDVVAVFKKFTIPKTWNNKMIGKTFKIKVQAEAVQSENYEPQKDENGTIISWNDDGTPIEIETYRVAVNGQ